MWKQDAWKDLHSTARNEAFSYLAFPCSLHEGQVQALQKIGILGTHVVQILAITGITASGMVSANSKRATSEFTSNIDYYRQIAEQNQQLESARQFAESAAYIIASKLNCRLVMTQLGEDIP